MRALCISLLVCLCRTSLVMSDFTSLFMNCTTDNDEHLANCETDRCIWNISLKSCDSLRYECSEKTEKHIDPVCSSLEECGLAKEAKFVKKLFGDIICMPEKKNINCFANLLCNEMIHVCEEDYCGMERIISPESNKEYHCKFAHSLTKCIQENEKFPVKGVTCTQIPRQQPQNQNNCHSQPNENNTGEILGIVLVLVILLFLGFILSIGAKNGWNTLCVCRNGQGAGEGNPEPKGAGEGNPEPKGAEEGNTKPKGAGEGNPEPKGAEEGNTKPKEAAVNTNPENEKLMSEAAVNTNPENEKLMSDPEEGSSQHIDISVSEESEKVMYRVK